MVVKTTSAEPRTAKTGGLDPVVQDAISFLIGAALDANPGLSIMEADRILEGWAWDVMREDARLRQIVERRVAHMKRLRRAA